MSDAGFRRVLRRFENAMREDEVRGSRHPDDWQDIEEAYGKAKDRLLAYVVKMASAAVRSSDMDVAIGEHAFGAGWDAALAWYRAQTSVPAGAVRSSTVAKHDACSDYTPPEELCGGGHSGG